MSNYTQLTRGQIITQALSQIGRTDLVSNARLWLNIFLEKMYRNQDLSWCFSDSGIVPLSSPLAFPTLSSSGLTVEYRKLRNANLFYQGVCQREITTASHDEYQALKRQGQVSGQPTRVWHDWENMNFNFWPTPDVSYSWQYGWFWIPQLPDDTVSGNDALFPYWKFPSSALIKAVQNYGLYFNDDARLKDEEDKLMKEIIDGKMNYFDTEAGFNKLKLGKNFRRRF